MRADEHHLRSSLLPRAADPGHFPHSRLSTSILPRLTLSSPWLASPSPRPRLHPANIPGLPLVRFSVFQLPWYVFVLIDLSSITDLRRAACCHRRLYPRSYPALSSKSSSSVHPDLPLSNSLSPFSSPTLICATCMYRPGQLVFPMPQLTMADPADASRRWRRHDPRS